MTKKRRALNYVYLGGIVVGGLCVASILGPHLFPKIDLGMDLPNKFAAPSHMHWLGLDQNGSDLLLKLLFGARVSLMVSLAVVALSLLLGMAIGSIAGWRGGWTDQVIMRGIDMLYAFPGFLLALATVAMLGPSTRNLIIALCLTGWTSFARLVRAELLHIKHREFILSSTALGASSLRLIVKHCWPNLLGPLSVQTTFAFAGTIITESGLSFLGLGTSVDNPSWGALLSAGRNYLFEAPHISLFAGLAILVLVLGFNLLGEGLRDYFDPKAQVNK